MKKIVRKFIDSIVFKIIPEIKFLREHNDFMVSQISTSNKIKKSNFVKLYHPYHISSVTIGDYTYISKNSHIAYTKIGKFCSIGPNFICGWGLHPINGISTSPMFYSAENLSNGISLCHKTKFIEHKLVKIGNDVFIGANVTILDGVNIGDGAVIGAGAVVTKDIPDFAVAVGVPAKVKKYRFTEKQISGFKQIKWWKWNFDKLKEIEEYFYDIEYFIDNNIVK